MDHVRRTERLSAITRMLVSEPNRSFSLGYFCETFGAAKSTVSEDLDIIRTALDRFSLGRLETLPGASGGVRYRPVVSEGDSYAAVRALCDRLGEPGRVLPGGLLFIADVIADPRVISGMGEIVASAFFGESPDFVLTMETQGIPLAMMTARAMNLPVIIARRSSKAYEGPAVHISYLAGQQFKTMSLPRKLVKPGQRALIIDDVLRSGGTASGMIDMMHEFSAEVAGVAMFVATEEASRKYPDIKPLMIIEQADHEQRIAKLRPGDWIRG